MQTDKITFEILPDGTIKSTTDGVSAANHDNAENFLRNVGRLVGGTVRRMLRTDLPKQLLAKLLREHAADGHTHAHGEHDHHHH